MEFIERKTESNLTADDTDSFEFVIPGDFHRRTFIITPTDDGSGPSPDDSTAKVLYWSGSDFQETNPNGSATTAETGKANVITREDAVSRVRIDIANGATPPNQGIEITLYGSRS